MKIREATEADRQTVLHIEETAFGEAEGPVIAQLVSAMLDDATASPHLSLLAIQDDQPVGHILFTHATIEGTAAQASLLAPMAVLPTHQKQGVGSALIRDGLTRLAAMNVQFVFVLGYPDFYTRSGFQAAGKHGLDAPYPIAEKNADAWMVYAIDESALGQVRGIVRCADSISKEEYWVK